MGRIHSDNISRRNQKNDGNRTHKTILHLHSPIVRLTRSHNVKIPHNCSNGHPQHNLRQTLPPAHPRPRPKRHHILRHLHQILPRIQSLRVEPPVRQERIRGGKYRGVAVHGPRLRGDDCPRGESVSHEVEGFRRETIFGGGGWNHTLKEARGSTIES